LLNQPATTVAYEREKENKRYVRVKADVPKFEKVGDVWQFEEWEIRKFQKDRYNKYAVEVFRNGISDEPFYALSNAKLYIAQEIENERD
jgi:hypothetical protein